MCDADRGAKFVHSHETGVLYLKSGRTLEICQRCWQDHCDDDNDFDIRGADAPRGTRGEMLRIDVVLVPKGNPEGARKLGSMMIVNDCTSEDMSTGNYDVVLSRFAPFDEELWKDGRVDGFPRKKFGPWDLVYRALRSVVGNRSIEPLTTEEDYDDIEAPAVEEGGGGGAL